MTTLATFPHPKDPRTTRWYTIDFGVQLASVGQSGITVSTSTNASVPSGAPEWTTAGDAVAGGPLTASMAQVAAGRTGITFQISGGVPGTSYAVCAEAIDANGNDLFGTVILRVGGQ